MKIYLKSGSPNTGGSAISGPYTGESGILSYYEICQKFKEGSFIKNKQKIFYIKFFLRLDKEMVESI